MNTAVSIAVASLALVGCAAAPARMYEMNVTAVSAPPPVGAVSFRVQAPIADASDTLGISDVIASVEAGLKRKGMTGASSAEQATMVVVVEFGMGAPQPFRELRTEPVARVVPGKDTTEQIEVGKSGMGVPIYTTMRTKTPPTTVYDETPFCYSGSRHDKFIRLTARENGASQREIWSVAVSAADESQDLRKYLPLMASVGLGYIDKNSSGPQALSVKATGSSVALVKPRAAVAEPAPKPVVAGETILNCS